MSDANPDPNAGPTPQEEWLDGDLRIVSSDDVLFRTSSYILFGSSKVLRDMAEAFDGEHQEIRLVDAEIERSQIVRKFLRVITTGKLHFDQNLDHILDLLKFCEKYECEMATQVVTLLLQNAMTMEHPINLTAAFLIGAATDNVELCTAALKRGCDIVAARQLEGGNKNNSDSILTIYDLPDEAWSKCPPEYMWALYRTKNSSPKHRAWSTFRIMVNEAKAKVKEVGATGPKKVLYTHCNWPEGDLSLTSADGVQLKVPSCHIQAASTVLSERLRQGNGSEIIFNDRTFEHSDVIDLFLFLTMKGKLPAYGNTEVGQLGLTTRLAVFLKRYNCVVAMEILALHLLVRNGPLHLPSPPGYSPEELVTATIIDSQAAVTTILHDDAAKSVSFQYSGTTPFNPVTWPFLSWRLVPPKWLQALCYAYGYATKWSQVRHIVEQEIDRVQKNDVNEGSTVTGDSSWILRGT